MLMPPQPSVEQRVPEISVNGDVLKWAREERGLSRQDAARLLGMEDSELAAYENQTKKPLVGTLRHMSGRYQINFVSLLLPARPPAQPKLHDFRTRAGQPGGRTLTIETLVAIQDVRDALDAFAALREDEPDLVPLPRLDTMLPNEAAWELAVRQRRKFGVAIKDQQGSSLAVFRDEWRRRIEAQGIFVYLRPMNPDDCRGFSMMHAGLAAICVNDRADSAGAETFTLFHEYAHLLRRQAGISDENRRNATERYCNRFAASFLIPLGPLREALNSPSQPNDYTDDTIRMLANRFKVTPSAMALRLEYSGLAPKGYYTKHTSAWRISPLKKTAPRMGGGPTIIERAKRVFGGHHTRVVLGAYHRGALNATDAHNMLDVPVAKFQSLAAVVG